MRAAELLTELGRLGIRLQADGDKLRYPPTPAQPPDFHTRMKGHKGELLKRLRQPSGFDVDNVPDTEPAPIIDPGTTKVVCRCGSTTWRDVTIHVGRSVRRDCARCGRFIEFPVWYGKGTGH